MKKEENIFPHNEIQITVLSGLYFVYFALLVLSFIISILLNGFRSLDPLFTTTLPFFFLFVLNSTFFKYYLLDLPKYVKNLSKNIPKI